MPESKINWVLIHAIDVREGRLFNSTCNKSWRPYTIRKRTYFANACGFSAYLKHSFIDFRVHSPQLGTFLNALCPIVISDNNSKQRKQRRQTTKRKISEHIQRWRQPSNLLIGIWFRGCYLPILSRCESDKIQSRWYLLYFSKRGYFAIVSKLKPDSPQSSCFLVALGATNL